MKTPRPDESVDNIHKSLVLAGATRVSTILNLEQSNLTMTVNRHNREFSQIGNVDAGVNVDVDSHPVGSSTPQNFQCQDKE